MMAEKAKKPAIRFSGFTDAWEQRKLGEITNSYSGGTPAVGIKEYYNGEIPFIRSAEINRDKTELFISELGLQNSSARYVYPGNILYALYGATSGEVGRSKLKGAINQAILAIIPHKGFDAEFIMQWLRKSKKNIVDTFLQGGQGNLSGAIVKNIELELPEDSEQQKIGQVFQSIDRLITLHQRKYDKLTKIKKSMLEKMFPKNGSNVPEIRFSGFSDAWEQRELGMVGSFYYGHSCPKWSVTEDATTPCIRYGELYTKFGTIVDRVFSYTSMPSEKLRFSKGTEVLIPRVGEDPMDYNHCTWLSLKGIAIGEMISVFNSDQNPLFMAIMFNATLRQEFAMRVEGGSVTNLYFEKLKNIEVKYPLISEQQKIGQFFQSIDRLITLHQRELDRLQKIKKSCLEKMFV